MSLPVTTAEGSLTLAEENLARTIAGCARWQAIVGAADEIPVNEVQLVNFGGATTGTFFLSNGVTSAEVTPLDGSGVQAACNALFGVGNTSVSGGGPFGVEFQGTLAAQNIATMTVTTNTTDGNPFVSTFTQGVGVTEADALARIYIDALPTPRDGDNKVQEVFTAEQLAALRPFILISQPPRQSYRAERVATDCYADAGSFVMLAEFAVDAADREDISEAFRKIKNDLGVLLAEMQALSYLPGYLAIDRLQVDGPFRCEDDDVNSLGDHVFAFVTIYWNGGLVA